MAQTPAQRKLLQCRRENGLCIRCGKALPDGDSHKQCESCRTRDRGIYHKNKPKNEPRRKPAVPISDVCRRAAERHISYGEMVLIIEKGDVKA